MALEMTTTTMIKQRTVKTDQTRRRVYIYYELQSAYTFLLAVLSVACLLAPGCVLLDSCEADDSIALCTAVVHMLKGAYSMF